MRRVLSVLLPALFWPISAHAQDITATIVFGDSSVDGGWWAGAFDGQCAGVTAPCTPSAENTRKNRNIANAIAEGSDGAPVGAGHLMHSEHLAGYLGTTADPANQPGGTNYAVSGSTNGDAADGPNNVNQNVNLPSTVQQIGLYLERNGGVANGSALYLISSGGNDISYIRSITSFPPRLRSYLSTQADALVQGVSELHDAGARYFVVYSNHGPGGPGTLGEFYTQQLWSGLSEAGINFVPADISAMVRTVRADPTRFGFTAETVMPGVVSGGTSTGSACVIHQGAGGPTNGWGQWCVNTTTPSSDYAYLASAVAQQTYFYADDSHLSAAGQKIEADYVYSLIAAPSQISMLAESAIAGRLDMVRGIQRQIEASWANKGQGGLDAWVNGDVGELRLDASPDFPDTAGIPSTLSAGLSYRSMSGLVVGAAVSVGRNEQEWDGGRGGFEQRETTASLYAGFQGDAFWGNVIGTFGTLDYDIERKVPLGISSFTNHGEAEGRNWSVGGRIGYDLHWSGVRTGPVAGLLWQRARIDGFTEAEDDFTSLGFAGQDRNSLVATLGWRASVIFGAWQPFAELAWNRELASDDREVTASLTGTDYAPAYRLPAVQAGEEWGTATLGATVDLGEGVLALGSLRTDFDEDGIGSYGAQLGLNIRF